MTRQVRFKASQTEVEALIAGAYLSGTNTRRVKRALAALFGGAVGKGVVSRTWRKVRTDWDAWNKRALAGENVVRLILDGTVVLLGPSGAGKSTLGNQLSGENRLATAAVRDADNKGRHTTAWRELIPLPHGGVLLDTPGLRGVGLHDADEGLDRTFAEITELARDCRFADCAHTTEPGCAVLSAVEDGHLTRRRLDSYHRLLRENAHAASRTDARLRAEQERPRKDIARLRRAINRSPHRKA